MLCNVIDALEYEMDKKNSLRDKRGRAMGLSEEEEGESQKRTLELGLVLYFALYDSHYIFTVKVPLRFSKD